MPLSTHAPDRYRTVADAIGALPWLWAGAIDPQDRLHRARNLSPLNMQRMQASRPGGTWRDWPDRLVVPCHQRHAGRTFHAVYGRLEWHKPAPTLTTQFSQFGSGRFGHPVQDRALSLREGALLQGFPPRYAFVPPDHPVRFTALGRLIGNAVPVALARTLARPQVPSAGACMTQSPAYRMQISLNVLEHLGLNLYSNVPAVLSEVVTNAWDADARQVHIAFHIAEDRIEIQDDGLGMTHAEVNDRFLIVGFRRRDEMPRTTPRGRAPMGRKGIGKLSLFSIAHQVDVHTVKNGEASAFRMSLPAMRHSIEQSEEMYCPEALRPARDLTCGTRFILAQLQKRHTINTLHALRKRLARRFSIIGAQQDFAALVDGEAITPSDRDYYAKLQYLWCYGNQAAVIEHCRHLSQAPEERTIDMADLAQDGVSLSGWIGAVQQSGNLKDDQSGDNLNRIAIYVRGKMAQEDILGTFSERGVYAGYLIGELQVDDFDQDEKADIATSSRQQIAEEDPRYRALQEFLEHELRQHIRSQWNAWRKEEGVQQARMIPAVRQWLDDLPRGDRTKAQAWIGRLNRITSDKPEDSKQLVKHAILAFAFYRAHQRLEHLERIDDRNLQTALDTFQELDALEVTLYGQIVQQRLAVIRTLQEKVDANDLERVIQQYIFNHLWLLDPHWERVESTALMESRVSKMFEEINATLTSEEGRARIDIRYRQTAGKHVIIELKRPSVRVTVSHLTAQIRKYRNGLFKILERMGEARNPIEIVILLGKRPSDWDDPDGPERVPKVLASYGARFALYDELLQNAYKAYADFERKKKSANALQVIFQNIDDFTPEN